MPSSLPSASAFTRKGKLFFIQSLEKALHLSALLAEIEFVFKNPQTREVVLYFKKRFRPFPNIVTPLACAIEHLRRNGRNVRTNETFEELEETNYLKPLGVASEPLVEADPVGKVWRYESAAEINTLLDGTLRFLASRLQWERGTLHALEWSLYELLDNVFQHAQAQAGYFMFQIQQERRRLSYCIADQGRGIYASFSGSRVRPGSPIDAITLAVQKGVTRDPDSNSGNGLWGASEIVAKSRGQLTISSGGAALYFNRVTRQSQSIPRVLVLDRERPGTFIDAQIDASVPVSITDMFDQLATPVDLRLENLEDDTGALRVNLKDMRFGAGTRQSGSFTRAYVANLMTQSDAPLVLNFDGVGIVSSSFADELVAKLRSQLGEEVFSKRIRFNGLNDTNNVIVRSVLAGRPL
jgi:anti-sigma regulatory factor (Ser/Thr protein kinase)